jgi:hypothetical protein
MTRSSGTRPTHLDVPSTAQALRRPAATIPAGALAGLLYGVLIAQLPAPHDAHVFWVGNFVAPWLALPFLAGWPQLSRCWWAAAAGAVFDAACVLGFYGQFLFIDQHPGPRGQASPVLSRLPDNLDSFLRLAGPWLVAALATGAAFGALGYWWRHSRSLLAGVALALPFLAEPWIWRGALGYTKGSWLSWAGETAVGAAILAAVAIAWCRSQRAGRVI